MTSGALLTTAVDRGLVRVFPVETFNYGLCCGVAFQLGARRFGVRWLSRFPGSEQAAWEMAGRHWKRKLKRALRRG